ncbi:MAG TPA: dihydroneopterin aldolase, partial [Candidatus Baltobacteraceae bacterium]
ANPGERDRPQPFDIDLDLELDLTAARTSDALADTLDYAALHQQVIEIVERTSFALLERLGDEILREMLADRRVVVARITLAKPRILRGATPSVMLSARRSL